LLGADPIRGALERVLVADAEKLAQQEVLSVHRDVGLELRLPTAVGALKRAQMPRGTLDRGVEILRRHDPRPDPIGYLPHRHICSGTDFHLPIAPACRPERAVRCDNLASRSGSRQADGPIRTATAVRSPLAACLSLEHVEAVTPDLELVPVG